MTDQTLDEGSALARPSTAAESDVMTRVLSMDAVLNSSRLVERTAHICLRGDLEDEFRRKAEELSALVDEDGEVRGGEEASLGDKNRATQLNAELERLHAQMQAETFTVRFRAMSSDQWETFYNGHLDSKGQLKDTKRFHDELIAKCAVEPALTVDEVRKLRGALSHPQMLELCNEAFWTNTTGGVDIPKFVSFSASQRQQDSSLS